MNSKIDLSNALPGSRRGFLKGAAVVGLTIGFQWSGARRALAAALPDAGFAPNAFLRIAPDDSVTVIAKHVEMGQGAYTGIATIVAEELDADWSKVRVESAPADAKRYANLAFGTMQGTGGSSAMANSWMQLREAGAKARAMLVEAAARQWRVPATELRTRDGFVEHPASQRKASYGSLAAAAAELPVPEKVQLKDPKDFRLIGHQAPRVDVPGKTDGSAQFTLDVSLPGMLVALLQRPADRRVAHVQALAEAAHGQFGGARRARAVADQIAIQRQRNPRDATHRALERGVATGIPAGVEVGEAVQRRRVVRRIAKQVGDAEIHAAAPAEHLAADAAVQRIGIAVRVLLGESDADLHRPAGVYRVEAAEQLAAHGHDGDEIVECLAQFLLRARRGQALAVGAAIGRLDIQRRADQERRHVQLAGTTLDLAGGDPAQAGHRRVDLVGGLLLGHRQHRTEILVAGVDLLGGKGRVDIAGPPLAIAHRGRHQADDLRPYFVGVGRRRLRRPRTAPGQRQEHEQPRYAATLAYCFHLRFPVPLRSGRPVATAEARAF